MEDELGGETLEMHTQFLSENPKERDLGAHGRIIL
jgi:hypothetical protein